MGASWPIQGEVKRVNEETMKTQKIIDDLQTISRDAETLVKDTAGEIGAGARQAQRRLKSALDSAKESCLQLCDGAVDRTQAADRTIREHPYQTIGIGFGIGLLIGFLIGRK